MVFVGIVIFFPTLIIWKVQTSFIFFLFPSEIAAWCRGLYIKLKSLFTDVSGNLRGGTVLRGGKRARLIFTLWKTVRFDYSLEVKVDCTSVGIRRSFICLPNHWTDFKTPFLWCYRCLGIFRKNRWETEYQLVTLIFIGLQKNPEQQRALQSHGWKERDKRMAWAWMEAHGLQKFSPASNSANCFTHGVSHYSPQGGPCGVLAAVQACVLQQLIFADSNRNKDTR